MSFAVVPEPGTLTILGMGAGLAQHLPGPADRDAAGADEVQFALVIERGTGCGVQAPRETCASDNVSGVGATVAPAEHVALKS